VGNTFKEENMMKKFLALLAVTVMAVGFSASAFASEIPGDYPAVVKSQDQVVTSTEQSDADIQAQGQAYNQRYEANHAR
jgi:uncharacterized protein YxeA